MSEMGKMEEMSSFSCGQEWRFGDNGTMKVALTSTNAPTPKALALLSGSPAERVLARWLGSKSEATRAAYSKDLDLFAAWMLREGYAAAPGQVAALDALLALGKGGANAVTLEWIEGQEAVALAPRTIARRLAALKSAVALACDVLDLVAWKLSVKAPKVGRAVKDTRGPGEDAVGRVLRHVIEGAKSGEPKAVRDWAMFMLLTGHGLRRIEVLRLNLEDVDLAAGRVWIQGKGRSEKEPISLVPESMEALAAWLEVRKGEKAAPVFVSVSRWRAIGEARLSARAVELVTKGAAKAVGEGRRFNPHGLRHTAISRCARLTGGDMVQTASFSRHASLATVKHYLDDLTDVRGKAAAAVAGGWGA